MKSLPLWLLTPALLSASLPVPTIPFAPRGYGVQRAEKPPTLDGRLDDAVWAKAAWTEDFIDIEGPTRPKPRFRTRAKLAWDDACLYVAAELMEPDVWAYMTERDSVIFQDNDFEIFIDPNGSTSPYFEFEMNARNTVWDLMLLHPYRDVDQAAVNGWDYHGLRTATTVQGTLNHPGDKDQGWTAEVAIPWASITEASGRRPLPGDRWRLNFSRVEWHTQVKDGRYERVKNPATGNPQPEDNWVWSPQGVVNMHYPEMWGILQFSGNPAGTQEPPVTLTPQDQARWALRRIYYAQRNRPTFGGTLKDLGLEDLKLPQGWTLRLEAGRLAWAAQAEGEGLRLRIDPQGAVRVVQPGS